jgi:hypothetical protein
MHTNNKTSKTQNDIKPHTFNFPTNEFRGVSGLLYILCNNFILLYVT